VSRQVKKSPLERQGSRETTTNGRGEERDKEKLVSEAEGDRGAITTSYGLLGLRLGRKESRD